jgi:hypothetical protein
MGLNLEVPEKNMERRARDAKGKLQCHGTTEPRERLADTLRGDCKSVARDAGRATTSRYLEPELRTSGSKRFATLT